MFARVVANSAPKVKVLTQSTRQMTVLSAPPKNKISMVEQIAHGIVLSVGVLAIPAWVLVNIQSYKDH